MSAEVHLIPCSLKSLPHDQVVSPPTVRHTQMDVVILFQLKAHCCNLCTCNTFKTSNTFILTQCASLWSYPYCLRNCLIYKNIPSIESVSEKTIDLLTILKGDVFKCFWCWLSLSHSFGGRGFCCVFIFVMFYCKKLIIGKNYFIMSEYVWK